MVAEIFCKSSVQKYGKILSLCPGRKGDIGMNKYQHLTLDARITIEEMLRGKANFSQIAKILGKDPTTISKEIRNHKIYRKTGAYGKKYNACSHKGTCIRRNVCTTCMANNKSILCKTCAVCNRFCPDFEKKECRKLIKPPYVCNGCGEKAFCTLEKCYYDARNADDDSRYIRSESRSGISFSEEELKALDMFLSPLVKKKQSIHHICATNRDRISISERTIYRLVGSSFISVKSIDLPRKVRYRQRRKTKMLKVDKSCRIGRDYACFQHYLTEHPDTSVVQIDSVEGVKGGKCLLTVHFTKAEMMLAFLRERNDSHSVTEIFNSLYCGLGHEKFRAVFPVILADNGTEFSNPNAIELNENGQRRTRLFYCDPQASWQKGSCERNHEFIRCFIPKGSDFGKYSPNDILTMMNHINSYSRESLGNKTPYDVFRFLYGSELLDLLCCFPIPSQEITLNNSVFREVFPYET